MPRLKKILLESGAIGALMCGSGPAVFGIFNDEESALLAVSKIKNDGNFAEICTPVKKLI